MPNTGGFSPANVPRPGAPFSRRRRPNVLVALLSPGALYVQRRHIPRRIRLPHAGSLAFFRYDPFAQLRCHDLGVILIQIQFGGNLAVGQVQAHQVQAQYPHSSEAIR